MKPVLPVFFGLSLLACLANPVLHAETPGFSGRVIDVLGRPIQGVAVQLEDEAFQPFGSATTDANGFFSIPVDKDPKWVSLRAPDYIKTTTLIENQRTFTLTGVTSQQWQDFLDEKDSGARYEQLLYIAGNGAFVQGMFTLDASGRRLLQRAMFDARMVFTRPRSSLAPFAAQCLVMGGSGDERRAIARRIEVESDPDVRAVLQSIWASGIAYSEDDTDWPKIEDIVAGTSPLPLRLCRDAVLSLGVTDDRRAVKVLEQRKVRERQQRGHETWPVAWALEWQRNGRAVATIPDATDEEQIIQVILGRLKFAEDVKIDVVEDSLVFTDDRTKVLARAWAQNIEITILVVKIEADWKVRGAWMLRQF